LRLAVVTRGKVWVHLLFNLFILFIYYLFIYLFIYLFKDGLKERASPPRKGAQLGSAVS